MTKLDLQSRPSAEVALVKDLLGTLPLFGPFLNYFTAIAGPKGADIGTAIQESIVASLGQMFDEIRASTSQIRVEIEAGRLTAEEMYWTVKQVAESMAQTPSEEKRKLLARVAVGGLAQSNRNRELHRILMKAMVQIDEGHIAFLHELALLPEDGIGIEKAVFDGLLPAVRNLGSPAVLRSYWSEMLSLSLVWTPRSTPQDWVQAELGGDEEEITRLRATDLGMALLDLLRQDEAVESTE